MRNIECIKIDPLVADTVSKLNVGLKYKIVKGKFASIHDVVEEEVLNIPTTHLLLKKMMD